MSGVKKLRKQPKPETAHVCIMQVSSLTNLDTLSRGKLSIRLYDKRDDFDFHTDNFPFLSSNIRPFLWCVYFTAH